MRCVRVMCCACCVCAYVHVPNQSPTQFTPQCCIPITYAVLARRTHDYIACVPLHSSCRQLIVNVCVCVPVCVFVPDLLPHFMCLCVACTACVWACLWRGVQPNWVKRTRSYVHVYTSCVCMLVMCPTLPCPSSCSFDAFRTRMHSLCPFALLLSPPRSSRAYT